MIKALHLRGFTSAGYNNYDLLDNNPDKYWQSPAIPAVDEFDIDLGEAKAVSAIAIFINNYKTDHKSDGDGWDFRIQNDTNDSGYETTPYGPVSLTNQLTIPILYGTFTEDTKRYWRFRIEPEDTTGPSYSTTLRLGCVWFCRAWTLIANEWPENDEIVFGNRLNYSMGGRPYRTAYRTTGLSRKPRTFYFTDDTNFGYAKSAYEDCRGSRLPLILIEDDTASTAKLCYFEDETFGYAKQGSALYQPTMTLIEAPYIPDGETY